MKVFGLLLFLVLTVAAGLAFYNWHIFIVPHELSFGFMTARIPFGLTMLGLLIIVTALFLMNMVYLLSSSILELRRHIREIDACRELANKAEASRMTDLKNHFETELSKQTEMNAELKSDIFAREDQIEKNFTTTIEQLENTLDAYIGELEDRLERTKYLISDNR